MCPLYTGFITNKNDERYFLAIALLIGEKLSFFSLTFLIIKLKYCLAKNARRQIQEFMKLKRQYKKERLQIFANNYVRKNTMRILLGLLIALATVACPASNSGGPQTGTFPYICPNGTPKAGMVATENTISCSDCNTGFNPVGTRCTNGCTGTAIATVADLMSLGDSGKDTGDFHLTSDIDLTGVTWTPKDFNGCLNGLGFVISNLSLSSPSIRNGLFSDLEESAMIQNLGLEDVSITGILPSGTSIGSIAATNAGTISASYAHGQITATRISFSEEATGGLVGINTGTIQESYAHVSIGSDSADSGGLVGGIVGSNSGGTIENSFATGGASSFVSGQSEVGGLVGRHQIVSLIDPQEETSIANSYSIAIRARGDSSSVTTGGLVGASEGYSPLSLGASIANSYTATQPLGASFLGGLVADANSLRTSDANIRVTTFTGKNYYTTTNGINGVGDGSCAAANCIQATGSTNAQRRTWLVDTLNEVDLGWSADIWNNLGMTGWPCLKRINDAFSGRDGCPPIAPLICPGGTAKAGNAVTGTVDCLSCTTALGYKRVGSECVRFEGDFSRIGTADDFGISETVPRGLASIEDTLYMVGQTNQALYTLDITPGSSTLGEATQVGLLNQGGGVSEFDPQGLASITVGGTTTLYMVGDTHDFLYTLDITPGSSTLGKATRVGSLDQNGLAEPRGLASIGDTLYMVGQDGADDSRTRDALYMLDITPGSSTLGKATKVGSANAFGVSETAPRGLASIGDTLYMVGTNTDVLYTLDTSSGIATIVGATSEFGVGGDSSRGLASIRDTLYMVDHEINALFKAVAE